MNCIGTYDGTIFYNPANKFCIVSVKTADQKPTANPDLSVYRSFYRNGKIDAERLKASSLNRYS